MKKLTAIIICTMALLLNSCSNQHAHTFSPSTCTTPRTCSQCGETRGMPAHTWQPAGCETPRTCSRCGEIQGTPLDHTWSSATCETPRICSQCGKTDGAPLGHTWLPATCTAPMKCSKCRATEGTALGHTMTEGTHDSPSMCAVCNYMEPLALPKSGQVFIHSWTRRDSEITIHCSESENCYVKLKNTIGNDVFSFFVRAGESVTVAVPSDYFYVYFSYGKNWYGTEYIFGSSTTYSKDDEICDFKNYTWEYTLYSSYNGNFTETPVSAEEFQ